MRKLTAEPRVVWPALTNTVRRMAFPLITDRAKQLFLGRLYHRLETPLVVVWQ